MPWILLHQTWHISIYIEQCTYTHGRLTPQPVKHRCFEYCYTKLGTSNGRSIYIERTMHMYPWQIDPPSIEHRCLEYCYTKLGRSNGRSIYIYRTMHIYPWQIEPTGQKSIDALNTSTPNLANLYIYRTMHIYLWQINPPCNWA